MSAPLRADHALDFTYRRSVGGSCERFLAGLARGQLWGSRAVDGRVVVPPVDHDPELGTPIDEFVRVGDSGVVRSWTWVAAPRPEHRRRDRPFAFALIQLDGADTALLHVVEAGDEGDMHTGMRVRADWRETRAGSISDIRAFVPGQSTGRLADADEPESVEVVSDVRIEYTYEPGLTLSGFLRALAGRRIEGGRCPSCSKVYVPPRARCPACGTGPMTPVPVSDCGTIVSYTVVHVPVAGARTDPPFAWAWIQLDGADVPFAHLLGDVPVENIRVGQRIQAVWASDDDLAPTWESIRHFAPVPP